MPGAPDDGADDDVAGGGMPNAAFGCERGSGSSRRRPPESGQERREDDGVELVPEVSSPSASAASSSSRIATRYAPRRLRSTSATTPVASSVEREVVVGAVVLELEVPGVAGEGDVEAEGAPVASVLSVTIRHTSANATVSRTK